MKSTRFLLLLKVKPFIFSCVRPHTQPIVGGKGTEPVIVVHGGAGNFSSSGKLAGVSRAAEAGSNVLLQGKPALDAVIAAVQFMEDDPLFNAGKGSQLNLNGEVEMDAIVMEGHTLKAGAIGGVKGVQHPVALARLVMDNSPHILLVGEGANDFAQKQGVPRIPACRLVTQSAIDALEAFLHNQGEAVSEVGSGDTGTVGAVALDANGNVAAATSTGGVTGKYPGRLGLTPLTGSGAYADNTTGAVSATGSGEALMRVCLCHRIHNSLEKGLRAQSGTEESLNYMRSKVGGTGGAVTVTKKGEIGIHFTTPRMPWAYRRGSDDIQSGFDSVPTQFDQK